MLVSSKNKAEGTEWETATVAAALSRGHEAERLAEGGSKDVSDVVVHHPAYAGLQELQHARVALAFKQYDAKPDALRRSSKKVYCVDHDTFWWLVEKSQVPWFIECKARERLNVGDALEKAKRKVALALQRRLAGQGPI